MKKSLLILIALFMVVAAVHAGEVYTHIKYIAAQQIYLDAGSAQGVQKGDTVIILRHNAPAAILIAAFVAEHSTACDVPPNTPALHEGDDVTILVTAQPAATSPTDTTHLQQAAVSATPTLSQEAKARRANRVSGRIGVQYLAQSDHNALHFNYSQPALTMRLFVDNLFGSAYQLAVRLNGRRTIRQQQLGPNTQSGWTGRVYEVALSYADPNSALSWSVGRVMSNHLLGILPFDGLQAAYRVSSHVSLGGVVGAMPDVTTTEPNGAETQYGAFAAYDRDAGHSVSATLGLIGQYHRGVVSREFLYQQFRYTPAMKFYLLESGEVNVNRGWKRQVGERSVDLANLVVNAGYTPISALQLGLSVDDRANYRTWETRTTPDSLFDDSRRQGTHLNAAWRPLRLVRLDGGGGLSWRNAAGHAERSANVGASLDHVPLRGSLVSVAWATFNNAYIKGTQPSAQISQQLAARWLVSAQIGRNTYDYQTMSGHIANNWFKARADMFFTRALYGAAYYEAYRGDSPDVNNIFVECGVRL